MASTIALVVALVVIVNSVKANSSYFPPPVSTATATTSPRYMTPGTATSTLTLDSYYQDTLGNYTKTDSAVLLTQFAGSSTASILGIDVEYSQDGIDWYKDNLNALVLASSTAIYPIQPNSRISWTFASSTVGGGVVAASTGATSTKAILITTPTRWIRVVHTITGANGAVWSQLVPRKEKTSN